jgi:hypothetical protein
MLQQMEKNGTTQPGESLPMKSFGEDMGSVVSFLSDLATTSVSFFPLYFGCVCTITHFSSYVLMSTLVNCLLHVGCFQPMIDEIGTGPDADTTPLPQTPQKKDLSQTDLANDPSLFVCCACCNFFLLHLLFLYNFLA